MAGGGELKLHLPFRKERCKTPEEATPFFKGRFKEFTKPNPPPKPLNGSTAQPVEPLKKRP